MFTRGNLKRNILIVILLFSSQLHAQTKVDNSGKEIENSVVKPEDVVFEAPGASVYFELVGKGIYSVNFDYRKSATWAMSVGVQWFEAFFPSLMYYHFGGKRHRLEIGGGLSGVIDQPDGFAGLMIHGVVGYRYQKKKGLIFRAGLTPSYTIPFLESGRYMFLPLPGISVGYSF